MGMVIKAGAIILMSHHRLCFTLQVCPQSIPISFTLASLVKSCLTCVDSSVTNMLVFTVCRSAALNWTLKHIRRSLDMWVGYCGITTDVWNNRVQRNRNYTNATRYIFKLMLVTVIIQRCVYVLSPLNVVTCVGIVMSKLMSYMYNT